MPEIIWKQGAESDLFQIFAELEERSEEAECGLSANSISRSAIFGRIPK